MDKPFFVDQARINLPKCRCGLRFREIQCENSEVQPWSTRVLLGCACGNGKFMYRRGQMWTFTEPQEAVQA